MTFGLAFVNKDHSAVRWRFLLAFQCFPTLLRAGTKLPDPPRYFASVGRTAGASDFLELNRGGQSPAIDKNSSKPATWLKVRSPFHSLN